MTTMMKLFVDDAPGGHQRIKAYIEPPGAFRQVASKAAAYRIADEYGVPRDEVDFGDTRDVLPDDDQN